MKKIFFTFSFALLLCLCLVCVANAAVYVEDIPDDLKISGDPATHFLVIEGAEYYTGSAGVVNGFNTSKIDEAVAELEKEGGALNKLGLSSSDLGTKLLTKIIIPAEFGGSAVTNADINNNNAFKGNKYFANRCGYLVYPSSARTTNDANERNSKIRCIDFGVDSQLTIIPFYYMNNATQLIKLLNMPKNLDLIDISAFDNCVRLQGDDNKQLYINAVTVKKKAFDDSLTYVESIVFGERFAKAETEAFSNNPGRPTGVKYIEFKCDVTAVDFVTCGDNTGAFYFLKGTQRGPYSNLSCIILSNPAQAGCDGKTFIEATGKVVYFNNSTGDGNIVYSSHNVTLEGAVIEYDSFLKSGTMISRCSRCNAPQEQSTDPIFECLGYSTPTDGTLKITVGFFVNQEAKEQYESLTGTTIEFGIVVAAKDTLGENISPLDEYGNIKELENGAVVMASVGEFDAISSYDFVLKGITPDYVDVEVLIASYLKLVNADQSTKVLYLQGEQIKDNKFYYCSYNSLAK